MMNYTIVTAMIPMLVGALVAVIAFFLSKTFNKVDASKDEINKLREEIGLLKAGNKKAWEQLDDQRALNNEILKKIQETRERIIFIEASK